MQRFEAAQILMLNNSNNISFLLGSLRHCGVETDLVFSDTVVNFLAEWSKVLLSSPDIRPYPDIATFAFFCRRSNINKIKDNRNNNALIRRGRGLVLHISPSNVPVNFAYSLVIGLLAGNENIVRVPTGHFPQIEILISSLKITLRSSVFDAVSRRIVVVRYDKNSVVTEQLSRLCQARVIWGGDRTVQEIRRVPSPPRNIDVVFPDRYSACVIDAEAYLASSSKDKLAEGFYNDTYLWGQGACTAPHFVAWRGNHDTVKAAKSVFWSILSGLVQERYDFSDGVTAVNKLNTFCLGAANEVFDSGGPVCDNRLWRVGVRSISVGLSRYRCFGGFFTECRVSCLAELSPVMDYSFQTLSYYGISKDELVEFVRTASFNGLDRVVPIGMTLDFSLNWDGYDLISTLSRCIEVK